MSPGNLNANERQSLLPTHHQAALDLDHDGITLLDGQTAIHFHQLDALAAHLGAFPEAENDQATRLFHYTSRCSMDLLVALFDKYPFHQFKLIPRSPVLKQLPSGFRVATCACSACASRRPCGNSALEFSVSLWQFDGLAEDQEQRLEVVGSSETFSIFAGGQKATFRLRPWSVQLFRFPTRRVEHTDRAVDVLLFYDDVANVRFATVPLEYVLDVTRKAINDWGVIMEKSQRFLGFYGIEALSPRLETDRSIIRHLLGAQQLWKSLLSLIRAQITLLLPIRSMTADDPWLQGAENPEAMLEDGRRKLQSLIDYETSIREDLIKEADELIQKMTNLISIDEGYRSRDMNNSIWRLSWVTFIFLPLLFVSGIFGMNVDLFQNNPAWWYYFIVAVPLAFLVIGLYLMFRYSSSFSTMVKRKILSSPTTTDATTDDSEAHVGVSTVLRWAAATGQIDTVAGLLGSDTYAMTSLAAGLGSEDTLIAAVTNGHEEIARLLLQRDGQVVDETDAQGATALHHAAGKGSLELVMLLLRHGANVHRSDSGGRKPLEWAMENRDEKCTAAILLAMYDGAQSVDPDTASLPSSIHVACAHFDLAMVKRLISAGYSRTTKDSQGRIPLFSALEANQDFFIEVADLYTKNELRDTDFHGLGLLHSAVELGLLGVIKYLVGCGLDVRLKTANELETPLHFVAKTKEGANRLWIMEYLVANGASKSAINSAGSTLAHLIAREDRPDSPTLLTSFVQRDKWRLKTQDSTGRTPVHIAAMWGRLPILKEMLKIADREILSIQDGEKLLAADLAARAGHLEAYQLLDLLHDGSGKETKAHRFDALVGQLVAKNDLPGLKQAYTQPGKSQPPLELSGRVFEAAIDASASNIINYFLDNDRSWITKRYGSYNGTVLVNAIARGTPDFVDFLLDAGAPVDGQDNSGWNALHVAAFWGLRPATTRRILEKSAAGKDEKDAYGWIPYDLAYFYYREDLYEILAPASLAKHTLPWWKGENVELGTGFEDEEFGGNVHPGSPGNEGKESRLPRFETTASSWAAGVDVVGRLAELAG